jgi:hypothetical protein
MQYKDANHYKAAMKGSGKFRKVNDYEVFDWAICLECNYFKIDYNFPIQGNCELMEQQGIYPGVVACAVCNRFMSKIGTDINVKVVNPSLLSGSKKNDGPCVSAVPAVGDSPNALRRNKAF